jgi:hypothetical protein
MAPVDRFPDFEGRGLTEPVSFDPSADVIEIAAAMT